MALITTIIPPQNFETIRDQVAAILALELTEQGALDTSFVVPEIGIDRITEIDKTEIPFINVSVNKGTYESQTPREQHGTNSYNIDVYTSAQSTDSDPADTLSRYKMAQIMGKCRAILMNPAYRTLGISSGIEIVTVVAYIIGDKNNIWDALSSVVGRIVLQVKCVEGTPLGQGILFAGGDTTLTIGETSNGYQIEISGT